MLILVTTASVSYASNTGDIEYSVSLINTALGFLNTLSDSNNYSTYTLIEAKAYLISMRDNIEVNNFEFNHEAIKIAKASLKVTKDAIIEANADIENKKDLGKALIDWCEQGEKMFLTSLDNIENVFFSNKEINIGHR